MDASVRTLPEYKEPPVFEVVCGVQFDPLVSFSSVHFGEFWQRVKKDYPRTEDRPPLAEVFEGGKSPVVGAEIIDIPPLRRVFFIDPTENFLLQVQPSRFLANWRKAKGADEYPRYSAAQDRFIKGWKVFVDFASEAGLGIPQANQYELTYINHIVEAGGTYPEAIEHLVPTFSWKSAQSTKFLPVPQSALIGLQFSLPDSKGVLYVSLKHGTRLNDQKGVLIVELTARGAAKSDWSDLAGWFDVAHEWIVQGFTDLTSPSAHQIWGRIR